MKIDLTEEERPPSLMRRLFRSFGFQYNVILLFGAASFSLALASPRPAAIGGVAELLWLLVAALFPGISRWIEEHNQAADAAADDREGRHLELDPSYRARASDLRQANDRIREGCRRNPGLSRREVRSVMGRLEAIRETFLRYAGIHQRLSRFLAGVETAKIDEEVARLTDELSMEKDPMVKVGLRQALVLSRRRLQQRDQLANALRGIEIQMSTIETASVYIQSMAASANSGRDLESEVDALVARTSPADVLEAEVGSVLSAATLAPPSMGPVPG